MRAMSHPRAKGRSPSDPIEVCVGSYPLELSRCRRVLWGGYGRKSSIEMATAVYGKRASLLIWTLWRPAFSREAISPHERYQTSVLEWDRQFRLVRVHHEHREELGRLRLAGIGADAVAVAGQLGEALSGLVGRHRSVVDLTADRSLKHGRVDEGGFG